MALPDEDLLEFEKAIDYMDPMQVTKYLQKILDFLNRNNTELCFPNITTYTEAFLVRLVTETKNLKSKSLNFNNEKLAADIIDVLEMNRDVFRWTHAYESGKHNKNLLVYKKIFSNKLKMKPAEYKVPTSTISQRLAKTQSLTDTAASSKIQLLNMTMRFIKDNSESTLYYPEMPVTQAQYIYSLLNNPKSDLNVGFGYKALCAPLYEALEAHGSEHVFEISFIETNKCETASLKLEKKPRKDIKDSSRGESSLSLKLEKKPRKDIKDSSRGESSLNSSMSPTKKSNKQPDKKAPENGIKKSFINKTLKRLINFTGDPEMASVTFQQISVEQIAFIKRMKTLAGNPESYGSLEKRFGDSLRQLNSNIIEVTKTCRLRIEERLDKKNFRFLTVKKIPKETLPSTSERAGPATRSQSVPSKNARERSLSKERRIKFESGGKLDPNNRAIDNSIPSATESITEQPKATDKKERGRSTERLCARKTKLLEDMSVPLESDRGIRMMLLMGWNGGALGVRGDGILEPIVPSMELLPGAGLGHVPPPKPEKGCAESNFRVHLLQNILELIRRNLDSKQLNFKAPLPKKDRAFINTLLTHVNKRSMLRLGVSEEVEMFREIMQAMIAVVQLRITANLDKTHKQLLLKKAYLPEYKKRFGNASCPRPANNNNDEKTNNKNQTDKNDDVIVISDDEEEKILTIVVKEDERRIKLEKVAKTETECDVGPKDNHVNVKEVGIDIKEKDVGIDKNNKDVGNDKNNKDVGNDKNNKDVGNDKSNKDVGNDKNNKDVGNDKNNKDVGNDKNNKDVGNDENNKDVGNDKNNKDVGNDKNNKDVGNDKNNKDVGNDKNNKDVGNDKNNKDVGKDKNNKDVGNDKNNKDVGNDKNNKDVGNDKNNKHVIIDKNNKDVGNDKNNKDVGNDKNNKDVGNDKNNKDVGNDKNNKDVGKDKNNKDVGNDKNNKDVGNDKNNKDVGNDKNNKYVIIDKNNKDVGIEMKKQTETDDKLSDSLCVCDTDVDICELDQDIKDLELAIFEADLEFEVKKENSNISPTGKRSRTNSINSQETSIKRSKITKKNCLIISPKDPEREINTDIVKTIQTHMSEEFDKCTYFLPLLKCHGIQKEGLIYSCHDENDAEWLEKIINDVDLDLKVCKSGDDFCIEQKGRKMAIKINSFIPVECKKFFERLETYNNGLNTALWKVLAEQTYESFVIIIVDVDESSFKYISKENFALYIGIDKAQFSVIY